MKKVIVNGASPGENGEVLLQNISDCVGELKLKSAAKECTKTLTFKLLRGDFDPTLPDFELELGDAIDVLEVDEDNGAIIHVFTGVVWEITKNDNDVAKQITCYDKAIYLNKSEPKTQVFEQKTPDQVAYKIISELGLTPGELATGEVDDFNLRNKNGYDGIMEAYKKESEKTGRKFKIVYKDGAVNVYEVKKLINIVIEELNEPVVGKLLNTSFKKSLDTVINDVKAIEDEKKDDKKKAASDEASQAKYGLIQKLVKGNKEEVDGLLTEAKKEIDVECIGDWSMETGKSIPLKSSIISGVFYITADEHTLDDAIHTCHLSLSSVYEM